VIGFGSNHSTIRRVTVGSHWANVEMGGSHWANVVSEVDGVSTTCGSYWANKNGWQPLKERSAVHQHHRKNKGDHNFTPPDASQIQAGTGVYRLHRAISGNTETRQSSTVNPAQATRKLP